MSEVRTLLGPDGPFAHAFAGYEPREGQVLLSEACAEAIDGNHHLIAEAPTGTGKSAAYILAAVKHALAHGKRVVIATANIALQEQLIHKDIPEIARVLCTHIRFGLMKGRNNFACHNALAELDAGVHRSLPTYQKIEELRRWARKSSTGDMSELDHVPTADVWGMVSATSESCLKGKCKFREECFSMRAAREAREAQIIVTNYHMLFAHISVREESGMDLVLPKFDVLICDEAHEIAATASTFFGFQLSHYTTLSIVGLLRKLKLDAEARALDKLSQEFFAWLAVLARSSSYHVRLRDVYDAHKHLSAALITVAALAATVDESALDEKEQGLPDQLRTTAATFASRLESAMTERTLDRVFFVEFDKHDRPRLKCQLVTCAEMLAREMFGRIQTVICVSATLSTGTGPGAFDFARRQLGAPSDARELIVESPFDYARQALLIVPDIPDPSSRDYGSALAATALELIEAAGGRTLCLFTSYRNLMNTYDSVFFRARHTCLKQGDAPRSELTRTFRDNEESCLFGTESFWTGIDVQGKSLIGLLIDKLPFPSPDDPVLDAIQSQDRNAFFNYSIPLATIKLRQGVGRLIRSKRDFGVVVICDSRLASKRYGRGILAALPPMRGTRDMAHAAMFLAEHGHEAEAPEYDNSIPF